MGHCGPVLTHLAMTRAIIGSNSPIQQKRTIFRGKIPYSQPPADFSTTLSYPWPNPLHPYMRDKYVFKEGDINIRHKLYPLPRKKAMTKSSNIA